MAHQGVNGKGDKKRKRSGDTLNHYARVHKWLNYHYGKAAHCENENCSNESKLFQWALIKGKKHEKAKENYMQLCRKCHAKYDYDEEVWKNWHQREWTQEMRLKMSQSLKGNKISDEHKKRLSELNRGSGNPMYGVSISGENHAFWGKEHSTESKVKLLEANAKVTKEQVYEIKKLVSDGMRQKEVALQFGISRASICRIVNNKRYKLWG